MTTRPNMPDLASYFMPFTAQRQFKANPRLLASASGMYYTDIDGNKILDGTAGLWCVNAGHGREEITRAVECQLSTLDYAPSFQMSHPVVHDYANRLVAQGPGGGKAGFDHVFFTNSGSESADTAIKIAIAYQRSIGQGTRSRVVGREKGYHGVGFGGISVGGLVNNRRVFPQIPADHMRHTLDIGRNAFSEGLPAYGDELADDLERIVQLNGAETIAAVIVEPVAGSAGVILPSQGYLKRLREIASKHGILLIFDEVITGFGRLGTPFAVDYFGVVPDMVTTAKGLTNGVVPMGAVFVQGTIYQGLMSGPEAQIELFHGYTYSGHPIACAAGLAVADIYARENLLHRQGEITDYWQQALFSLKDLPNVIDIRVLGLMAGVELKPHADAPAKRGYEVFVDCFQKGALVRQTGDVIAMSPPLIVEKSQIDDLVSILADAIKRVD